MRRTLVFGALLAAAASGCGGSGAPATATPAAPAGPATGASAAPRPNIVFIFGDDLDWEPTVAMPRLRAQLIERGVTFHNAFASFPLCAPSRATILTGRYAHNHGVTTNSFAFELSQQRGIEASNMATMLRAAGYRTALVGKYQNNYPAGNDTYVPPGWDEWYALLVDRNADYFGYSLNENGRVVTYGGEPEDYQTDVLARKAVEVIQRAEASDAQPFFIHLSLLAPHLPARAAHRYRRSFEDRSAPRTASFNEADVSDKPAYLRRAPLLRTPDIEVLDDRFRLRLRAMAAADDLLERVLNALAEAGELENTHLVFTGDNGYMMGQHRFPASKDAPYEESIRIPLVVRGPGVPAGVALDHIVGNVDFLPTFLEIAGVPIPPSVDGRSLMPLLRPAPPPPERWRAAFLLEGYRSGSPIEVPAYSGVRTSRYTYVEYETREAELYDLARDPDQLNSAHESTNPVVVFELKGLLDELKRCSGASCRELFGAHTAGGFRDVP